MRILDALRTHAGAAPAVPGAGHADRLLVEILATSELDPDGPAAAAAVLAAVPAGVADDVAEAFLARPGDLTVSDLAVFLGRLAAARSGSVYEPDINSARLSSICERCRTRVI